MFFMGLYGVFYAAPADPIEDAASFQNESLSGPIDSERVLGSDISHLLELQIGFRDYEVQKLLKLLEDLMVSISLRYPRSSFNSEEVGPAIQELDEAYQIAVGILLKIRALEIGLEQGREYASDWHNLIPQRNSAVRKFIRAALKVINLDEQGRPTTYFVRSAMGRHLENMRWLRLMVPYYRELRSFFGTFYSDPQNSYDADFIPAMHRLLRAFAERRRMPFQFQFFTDELRAAANEPGLHLWIMNHRDIYLDPLFVSQVMSQLQCGEACYYAMDPLRYFSGISDDISRRTAQRPDFLPVGTEAGEAIKRLRHILSMKGRAQVFFFPEATTSLIGDTSILEPYFSLAFLRSIRRVNVEGGIHLHLISTDAPVSLRVDFRQRISQLFQHSPAEVGIRYHGTILMAELPRKITPEVAARINLWIWAAFMRGQKSSDSLIAGQLKDQALRRSVDAFFRFHSPCRDNLLRL